MEKHGCFKRLVRWQAALPDGHRLGLIRNCSAALLPVTGAISFVVAPTR